MSIRPIQGFFGLGKFVPAAIRYIKGDTGAAATVAVGETTTLPAGSSATVQNVGDENNAVFKFGIPKGDKGDPGTSIPLPVSVANGGTGATTTAAARANLGAVNKTGDTMTGGLTARYFTATEAGSSFSINPASGTYTTLEHPGILTVTETSGGAVSVAFLPGTTPAAAKPGKTIVLGESLPASETWTFTVDDGQGGTTTVTKNVAVYAAQGAGA